MKRRTLALTSIILVSSAATAQTEPRLARLEVALWPEYDRPAVLVMLQGWLTTDTALPATVRLPMPAQAGRPHAVAKRTPDGMLLLAQHRVDFEGKWARVNLMTDVREVRLEYYVDLASIDPGRRYVFEWPGGLDIEQVTYEVMQPIGAKDFSVEPSPSTQSGGKNGITYHLGDLGPKARKDTFFIEITYTKISPTLTAVALQVPAPPGGPTPPVGSASGGRPAIPAGTQADPDGVNKWLVAFVIVLAAAVGGASILMSSKKPQGKR
ncbi:MAG: hypothetical protein ACE5JI_22295 [Acidobacteriota bacterium]